MKKTLFIILLSAYCISADVYLHNLRGSNNRLNEDTRERNNANRLFDSQNNNRGGYNAGNVNANDVMTFFGGSKVKIEWSNQHSCGDENNHCDIIIQYMCSDNLRDGTTNPTIPEKHASCKNNNCNLDGKFGMHEDYYHYHHCKARSRNGGLFLADQVIIGLQQATKTRQNPGGTRRGYECAEERDYYPYWHYSEWKDIAVLTNNCERCEMYQSESQNVKDKFYCNVDKAYLDQNHNAWTPLIPITEDDCVKFQYTANGVRKTGVWAKKEAFYIDPPVCIKSRWSRDNHHGNTIGGQMASFIWTVPDNVNENHCTLRLRYNISTGDFNRDFPNIQTFTGNPKVDVFNLPRLKLQLAINTAQFGRTFQDRSHRFSIKPRPSDIENYDQITNINVRGKRGNIVQVYPAVEYDFTPNHAKMGKNSRTHFQWTGSDNNPADNKPVNRGYQGPDKTDRHNAVMLWHENKGNNVHGDLDAVYPSHFQLSVFGGMKNLDSLANVPGAFYYNNGLQKITESGAYNYMGTHNNYFSVLSQKGTLVVYDEYLQTYVKENGGVLKPDGLSVEIIIPESALRCTAYAEVGVINPQNYWPVALQFWPNLPKYTDFVSNLVDLRINEELQAAITIKLRWMGEEELIHVFHSPSGNASWIEITDIQVGTYISFNATIDGRFIIAREPSSSSLIGVIIGCVIGGVLLCIIIGLLIYKFCPCPTYDTLGGYGDRI